MTDTLTDPNKKPDLSYAATRSKRYRVKRCNAKLRVPDETNKSEVVFSCQKQEHHVNDQDATTWHQERAFIDYGNDSGREAIVTWKDSGTIATRRRVKQLKVVRDK